MPNIKYSKFLFNLIFLFTFLVFCSLPSICQDEIPEDVVTGGKAVCRIVGKSPIKSGFADGNRLHIFQQGEFANGSIIIQRIIDNDDVLIDVRTLAFFNLIEDLNGFLSGNTLNFESTDSDLVINKKLKNKDVEIEVSNILEDGLKGKLIGKIKITSTNNNLANGKLDFIFEKTVNKVTKNSQTKDLDNGKVEVKCKFKDIPLVISEL